MEITELVAKTKKDFNDAIFLISVIPFLVFAYLLFGKIASWKALTGEIGYILIATVFVILTGIILGRQMLWTMIKKLIDFNAQVIKMQEELIEKNRLAAITETTLALGHEINNPLLAIRGNLELLDYDLAETELKEDTKGRLSKIKGDCERIRQVTEKMSKLSKPVSTSIFGESKMIDLTQSK